MLQTLYRYKRLDSIEPGQHYNGCVDLSTCLLVAPLADATLVTRLILAHLFISGVMGTWMLAVVDAPSV